MSLFRSTQWKEMTFAIIGLGLMGGSYAKALRRLGVKRILGYNRTISVAQQALSEGVIDQVLLENDCAYSQADVLLLCTYPQAMHSFLKKHAHLLKTSAIVTDAAGIKGQLCESLQSLLPPQVEFVGGHPMAGRQGSGFAQSSAELFDGANYIVVRASHNHEETLKWLENFAKALGFARTIRTTSAEHDQMVAYTSDLTHVLSVALASSDSFNEKTCFFAGGSFKDATRVADINPVLWSELFISNKNHLLKEVELLIGQLEQWRQVIKEEDREKMTHLMNKAAVNVKTLKR